MNAALHCKQFENDAVTFAMTPACQNDTDFDITGISAFGFYCHNLDLC